MTVHGCEIIEGVIFYSTWHQKYVYKVFTRYRSTTTTFLVYKCVGKCVNFSNPLLSYLFPDLMTVSQNAITGYQNMFGSKLY